MSDQLANKKSVWVFRTNTHCPLDNYELLVYSYMAYQAKFGTTPSLRAIHLNTGMSKDTAGRVCKRLQDHGLLDANGDVCGLANGKLDWFQVSDHLKAKHDHFSRWITNWRCYIRQPGIDLTLDCMSIYSYIRHCAMTGFRPHQGMTPAYVGAVVGVSPKTASEAFERLQTANLIRVDGKIVRTYRLTDEQLSWFMDKADFVEDTGGGCEYVDELPPPAELDADMVELISLRDGLIKGLNLKRSELATLKSLMECARRVENWRNRWRGLLEEAVVEPTIDARRERFVALAKKESWW